jgi:D-2-hydroxyglutarate dehydrogenase
VCVLCVQVVETAGLAQGLLCEIMSAMEFFDRECLDLILSEEMPGCRDPLSEAHAFYLLLETAGSNEDHDRAKLGALLDLALAQALVEDGVVAQVPLATPPHFDAPTCRLSLFGAGGLGVGC